jgi:hypothetical protein
MAEMDFEKLFEGGTEGLGADAVPGGTYDMKVLDTRSKNRTVFIDFEVLTGPHAGDLSQVTLWIPDEKAGRGAKFHFTTKLAGFQPSKELGAAMNGGDPAPILAEAINGATVSAELTVQTEGAYAGTNELVSTKPLSDDVAPKKPAAKKHEAPEPDAEAGVEDAPEEEDVGF